MSAVQQDIPVRSAALQRLYDRNRGEVTLKSGVPVGLALIPMSECFDAGTLPASVTAKVIEAQRKGDKLSEQDFQKLGAETMEDTESFAQFRLFVSRCIVALWGEEVSMTPEDTKEFSDQEFIELMSYCTREKPLPGKE